MRTPRIRHREPFRMAELLASDLFSDVARLIGLCLIAGVASVIVFGT